MAKYGRKNHVKVDPTFYNVMLLGEPKIGKTTVMKEVLEKLTGEEGYMFAELGRERGADAIEGINCINCPTWSMEYDEDTNSIGWEDLVEDIVENKTVDYPDLRVIAIDTYDQYISIAEDESIASWNRKNPDKRTESINSAWGGFGAGGKKAIELMFEMIDKLNSVGVRVWFIGHVKNKQINDVVTGESYEVLSSDQQQNYFNALKKNLHFLGLAYIDREIVKEKTGKKNIVTKKEETKAVVAKESRKIKFRDDSYAVDSGSRFSNIISEIDLDADQFINAMVDAIKSEQSKSGKSFEETKAEQDAVDAKRLEEIARVEKAKKEEKEISTYIEKINDFLRENKTSLPKIKPIITKLKELGYATPAEINSLDDAITLANMI